jgi:hypothetical protein
MAAAPFIALPQLNALEHMTWFLPLWQSELYELVSPSLTSSLPVPIHDRHNGDTQRMVKEASGFQNGSRKAIHRPATIPRLATTSSHADLM